MRECVAAFSLWKCRERKRRKQKAERRAQKQTNKLNSIKKGEKKEEKKRQGRDLGFHGLRAGGELAGDGDVVVHARLRREADRHSLRRVRRLVPYPPSQYHITPVSTALPSTTSPDMTPVSTALPSTRSPESVPHDPRQYRAAWYQIPRVSTSYPDPLPDSPSQHQIRLVSSR
eukprot:3937236-Rhodomonas_salina.2